MSTIATMMIMTMTTTAVTTAAMSLASLTTETVVIALLTFTGVQVLVTVGIAKWLTSWHRTRTLEIMREEQANDQSAFGRHRLDPYAHEPLRRQLMADLGAKFDAITAAMDRQADGHRAEMANLASIVRPVVEQNGRALEVLARQMRRQGPAPPHDDEDGER